MATALLDPGRDGQASIAVPFEFGNVLTDEQLRSLRQSPSFELLY